MRRWDPRMHAKIRQNCLMVARRSCTEWSELSFSILLFLDIVNVDYRKLSKLLRFAVQHVTRSALSSLFRELCRDVCQKKNWFRSFRRQFLFWFSATVDNVQLWLYPDKTGNSIKALVVELHSKGPALHNVRAHLSQRSFIQHSALSAKATPVKSIV